MTQFVFLPEELKRITPSYFMKGKYATYPIVAVPVHPQLRDLITYTRPREIATVKGSGIALYNTANGVTNSVFLDFTPVCITSGRGLVAVGGQEAQIAIASSSNLDTLQTATSARPASINNSMTIVEGPSPQDTRLLVANNDASMKVFDVAAGRPALSERPELSVRLTTPVNQVSMSPDGRHLLAVGDSNDVFLFDCARGEYTLTHTFSTARDASFTSDWHPDSAHFAIGSQDGTLNIYDIRQLPPADTVPRKNTDFLVKSLSSVQRGTPGGAVRKVKFSAGDVGSSLLAYTEHRSYVHIVDSRTYDTEQIIRVGHWLGEGAWNETVASWRDSNERRTYASETLSMGRRRPASSAGDRSRETARTDTDSVRAPEDTPLYSSGSLRRRRGIVPSRNRRPALLNGSLFRGYEGLDVLAAHHGDEIAREIGDELERRHDELVRRDEERAGLHDEDELSVRHSEVITRRHGGTTPWPQYFTTQSVGRGATSAYYEPFEAAPVRHIVNGRLDGLPSADTGSGGDESERWGATRGDESQEGDRGVSRVGAGLARLTAALESARAEARSSLPGGASPERPRFGDDTLFVTATTTIPRWDALSEARAMADETTQLAIDETARMAIETGLGSRALYVDLSGLEEQRLETEQISSSVRRDIDELEREAREARRVRGARDTQRGRSDQGEQGERGVQRQGLAAGILREIDSMNGLTARGNDTQNDPVAGARYRMELSSTVRPRDDDNDDDGEETGDRRAEAYRRIEPGGRRVAGDRRETGGWGEEEEGRRRSVPRTMRAAAPRTSRPTSYSTPHTTSRSTPHPPADAPHPTPRGPPPALVSDEDLVVSTLAAANGGNGATSWTTIGDSRMRNGNELARRDARATSNRDGQRESNRHVRLYLTHDGLDLSFHPFSRGTLTHPQPLFGMLPRTNGSNSGLGTASQFYPLEMSRDDLLGLDWSQGGGNLIVAGMNDASEWTVNISARMSFAAFDYC